MPGTLAKRQQDWQRGLVPLTCWSKETWSGPFNHLTKCSSELLLWNQYDEKLCIIHLILCCYTTEKTKKPKPVWEVERHTWEIMFVSGSRNFVTHYKLKPCNNGRTGPDTHFRQNQSLPGCHFYRVKQNRWTWRMISIFYCACNLFHSKTNPTIN